MAPCGAKGNRDRVRSASWMKRAVTFIAQTVSAIPFQSCQLMTQKGGGKGVLIILSVLRKFTQIDQNFKYLKIRREVNMSSPALNRPSLQNQMQHHLRTTEKLESPPLCSSKYCTTLAQHKQEQGDDSSCPLTACTFVLWRSKRKPHSFFSIGGKAERFQKQGMVGCMS